MHVTTITDKIQAALAYVSEPEHEREDIGEVRNDAANIYADSYAEYMMIWDALLNATGA